MFGNKNGRERGSSTSLSSLSNSNDRHLEVDALIGPQVTIRGDVIFSGSLYVEGRIEGNVVAEEGAKAELTLSEQGDIKGEIRASIVILSGRLEGDVHASERIELSPTSRVTGNIHYQVVQMSAGSQLNGRLLHSGTMAALPAPEAEASNEANAAKTNGKDKNKAAPNGKNSTANATSAPAEKNAKT